MTEINEYGVCISSRAWHENDKMLTVFCESGNVYSVLAKGALKPKYKLKFAAQPFSACNYFLRESKAGYYLLGGADFSQLSFLRIAESPDCFVAASAVCEIASKCVVAENKRMYAEVISALTELSGYEEAKPYNVCLRVLIASFALNGYGAVISGGERGDICNRIADAPRGCTSAVEADPETVLSAIKTYGNRFSAVFGKLNSLELL